MIIIIIFLLFSYYLFWTFEQKRKISNAAHRREKREALINLLDAIKKNNITTDNKTEEL